MKKVNWWKSKYSDFTHKEESEDYVTYYLKPNVELSKMRTCGIIATAEEVGSVVRVVTAKGVAYVLVSPTKLEQMYAGLPDDFFDHSSGYL
jgi:uncharacterized protein YcbX